MQFSRRLRLYLMGFIPGCFILAFIINKKGCTSPNELKMLELTHQYFELSPKAACKIKCMGITEKQFVIKLNDYEVNYDLSQVHKKPYGEFYIQSKDESPSPFEFVAIDQDTNTVIHDIKLNDLKWKDCPCDTL